MTLTQNEFELIDLLSNDSFINWLKGISSNEETNTWQQWHHASRKNQVLMMQAKMIMNMPFNTPEISAYEVRKEVEKFERQFMRLLKKPDTQTSFF